MSGKISDNLGRSSGLLKAVSGAAVLSATQTNGPTSRQSFTNTSFAEPSTNLEVTITPQSTSSKILIICGTGMHRKAIATIYRDSTNLGDATNGFQVNPDDWNPMGIICLDSPATTSEIVYTYQMSVEGQSGTGYINNNNEHHHMQCIEIKV